MDEDQINPTYHCPNGNDRFAVAVDVEEFRRIFVAFPWTSSRNSSMDDLINDRTRRDLRFEPDGSSFDLERSSMEDDRLLSSFVTGKNKSSINLILNILPAFIDRYISEINMRT